MNIDIKDQKTKFKFPIWGWFFVFFAVVFTVDGIMVYIASTTWNGLTTDNAYERGLNYNKTLAENLNQQEQGWIHEIELQKKDKGDAFRLYVTIISNDIGPLPKDSKVTATFFRPTQSGYDKTFLLSATTTPGQYTADNIELPLQGLWDIKLTTRHNNESYKAVKRMDIRW
mgnify:CR=1 FL=1|tara:strand:- start:278500 stop:279012 length:513 start_codon:yes stop_codon:yes gene_type:complete